MRIIKSYFDYVSPFSYFLHEQLRRLPSDVSVEFVPVLFAGLLKHWGTVGPVDIERKKLFTYRMCTWVASNIGVEFHMPPSHPFNPLPYLRLTLALNCDEKIITDLFRTIWTRKIDPSTTEGRNAIFNEIGVLDADAKITDVSIKKALIKNTQEATSNGVFGVPTLIIDDQLFWGLDSLDFLLEYLKDSNLFQTEEMKRLESIRYGVPSRN